MSAGYNDIILNIHEAEDHNRQTTISRQGLRQEATQTVAVTRNDLEAFTISLGEMIPTRKLLHAKLDLIKAKLNQTCFSFSVQARTCTNLVFDGIYFVVNSTEGISFNPPNI